jgi:hypothetical protein
MAAEIPRIAAILKMLEPMMLPTDISPWPDKVAFRLTTSSGALVPNATIVRPITRFDIFAFRANSELPLTNQPAPI